MGIEGLYFLAVMRGIALRIDCDKMRMSTILCSTRHELWTEGRGVVHSTCNSLREDEGVPIPFYVHGGVLFLLLRESKTLYPLLQRAVVGNVGDHRGKRRH